MKLAAIYNVWDGVELLRGSMERLRGHVDVFIIVWQDVSNYGEHYNPLHEMDLSGFDSYILLKFEPVTTLNATKNEIQKRYLGIEYAKQLNCTHFLHLDCDEYYQDFGNAKQQYIDSGAAGSVCRIFTYFKQPDLRLENEDNYYVPFIHKLFPETINGFFDYPFYVDPTRRINNTDIALLDVYMHHYSWIRKDIERKVRNSSARKNIERSQLLQDYYSLETKAGYFLKDYNQKLIQVENWAGITAK